MKPGGAPSIQAAFGEVADMGAAQLWLAGDVIAGDVIVDEEGPEEIPADEVEAILVEVVDAVVTLHGAKWVRL